MRRFGRMTFAPKDVIQCSLIINLEENTYSTQLESDLEEMQRV